MTDFFPTLLNIIPHIVGTNTAINLTKFLPSDGRNQNLKLGAESGKSNIPSHWGNQIQFDFLETFRN